MKVLFINSVCGQGSTGRIVVGLLNMLRQNGDDGKIFFGVGEAVGVREEDAVKINSKFGYVVHNLLAKITDHTGLYSSRQTHKLIEFIKDYKPDIIHIHNLHGYYINYKILFEFLKESNIPVVWTLHDCWSFTGHCAHFVSESCTQWQTECKSCNAMRGYPVCYTGGDVNFNYHTKKESFTSVKNLYITTPSNWLADNVRKSFLSKYPIYTINNGIDTSIFKPTKSDIRERLGLSDKKIVLGVSGVWSDAKGLSDIYELSRMLDSSYKVVIVGLNGEQLRNIPKDVSVCAISRTSSQQELAGIYSEADVFVNPTYEDTFPTVNLEALACGTYVVTYDTCGCPETLLNGFGTVVNTGDIKTMFIQVVSCCKNNIEQKSNIDYNNNVFSNALSYKRYTELYKEILNN